MPGKTSNNIRWPRAWPSAACSAFGPSVQPVMRNLCRKSSKVRLFLIFVTKFFYQFSGRKSSRFKQVFKIKILSSNSASSFHCIIIYNPLDLIGRWSKQRSVTQLWRHQTAKYVNCRISFHVSMGTKYKQCKDAPRNKGVIVQNKWHVSMAHRVLL